ncbi:MAG: adenylyltransferase/cytidyltransferase family protein [Bacteroidia bacterium]|nr:adenylyltransferase/cytidyltransferase family protein [Bacteroidia bacterium]
MKIGFTCGVFDLFHAGHVLMLKECKQHCDYLIVALNKGDNICPEINPDKEKPIYSIEERKLIMESCRYVDEVIIYNSEEELLNILKSRKIDIRFLGEDYKGKKITGEDLVPEIHYTDRSHGLSSTSIKDKIRKHGLK